MEHKSKFLNNPCASSTTFATKYQFCLGFLKTPHPPKFVRNPTSSYLEDICYSFLSDFPCDVRILAGQESDGKSYEVVFPGQQNPQQGRQREITVHLSWSSLFFLDVGYIKSLWFSCHCISNLGLSLFPIVLMQGLLAFKGGLASALYTISSGHNGQFYLNSSCFLL